MGKPLGAETHRQEPVSDLTPLHANPAAPTHLTARTGAQSRGWKPCGSESKQGLSCVLQAGRCRFTPALPNWESSTQLEDWHLDPLAARIAHARYRDTHTPVYVLARNPCNTSTPAFTRLSAHSSCHGCCSIPSGHRAAPLGQTWCSCL